MSLDMDDEIYQDFLVEAGEILEQLSEQLVELEKSPDDKDLLNAIFRGFHTVKGGAGFLALTPLVETCHCAENAFDNLRKGAVKLSSPLMDAILQALDTINEQFDCVRERKALPHSDPELIAALQDHSRPQDSEPEPKAVKAEPKKPPEPAEEAKAEPQSDEITEEEFEQLLDELKKEKENAEKQAVAGSNESAAINDASDDITDEEFEKLLDELHGKKKICGPPQAQLASIPPLVSQTPPLPEKVATEKPAVAVYLAAPENTGVKAGDKKASSLSSEPTIRVDTETLDTIMNMVGELVLVRNRLMTLSTHICDDNFSKVVTSLDVVTGDLQTAVMKTRMQPIKKVFGRFPRVVRDLARSLKKEIALKTIGEETDLDKNLVEALADPMVHLVRNSIDHGIEMPDEREKNGKPREGTVTLSAVQQGDHILLTVEDDGAGMDPDKLRRIAVDRGLMKPEAAERLSENEAFALIFAPGFSTKTEISDISGRGVGMDVVKTAINRLNGSIEIDSKLGQGTKIYIKVPLTLAILPTLMVGVDQHPFAFPLSNVSEIINLDLKKTHCVDGQLTLIVREKAIPLFYLHDWFSKNAHMANKDQGHVVIIQLGLQQIAFVVDILIGQEEVVIKSLDPMLHGTPGIAGATITSDGHIALILDVPNLLKRYVSR
ncbi:MAG: chemotaxis protein CheA [Enterovibrio sp.]